VQFGHELPVPLLRDRVERVEPFPGGRVADQRDGEYRVGGVTEHALLGLAHRDVVQAALRPVERLADRARLRDESHGGDVGDLARERRRARVVRSERPVPRRRLPGDVDGCEDDRHDGDERDRQRPPLMARDERRQPHLVLHEHLRQPGEQDGGREDDRS
jgi:hypothetical protein